MSQIGVGALAGEDASRGEGATVAHALDAVFDRHARTAATQEVCVERVQRRIGRGAARGDSGLAEHEAAEDARPVIFFLLGRADEAIRAGGFDVQDADEFGDRWSLVDW